MRDELTDTALHLGAAAAGHTERYSGVWAMEAQSAAEVLSRVAALDLAAHVGAYTARSASRERGEGIGGYRVDGGVAIVDVVGMMTKRGSSLSAMEHGTIGVRRALRSASRDEQVRGILLYVDSPGGSVDGTADLADEVLRARRSKPVHAFVDGLSASAAYWVTAQASHVVATRTALVGSIGTYSVVRDTSQAHADAGVTVHVVRSGAFKGAGTPGAPVSEDELADLGRVVADLNRAFVGGVASGRRLTGEQAAALADGRVHVGDSARALGLVDAIGTLEDALASFGFDNDTKERRGARGAALEPGVQTMDQGKEAKAVDTPAPVSAAAVPADYAALKSGLPGADAAFICSQLEAHATLGQAQSAWMAEQNARIESAESAAKTRPGVPALGSKTATDDGGEAPEDPVAAWLSAVSQYSGAGVNPKDAVKRAAHAHPELRMAMLAAHNHAHGRGKAFVANFN